MPASGPVIRRSSPIRALIRVDLPALGRADHGNAQRWRIGIVAIALGIAGQLAQPGLDGVIEIADATAVSGRDGDGVAQAEPIGVHQAALTHPAFTLVGQQNDGACRSGG